MNCQQFELYASEVGVPRGRSFRDVKELQEYVDAMRDTPYWERNFAEKIIRVDAVIRRVDNRRGSAGGYIPSMKKGVIEMDHAHLTELFVNHEVAHVVAAARYGSRSHDPWFARTYLELVSANMGQGAYLALYNHFVQDDIDFDTDNANNAGVQL